MTEASNERCERRLKSRLIGAMSSAYSLFVPSMGRQATVADPPSIVRVRENELGFTQIDFRWPVRLNNINSRLQEQVWEDGESYVVFNKSGNRIFCSCEGDVSYDAAFKRTNKGDIYYFVDRDYVSAPLKYRDVTCRYTFFSLSGKGRIIISASSPRVSA